MTGLLKTQGDLVLLMSNYMMQPKDKSIIIFSNKTYTLSTVGVDQYNAHKIPLGLLLFSRGVKVLNLMMFGKLLLALLKHKFTFHTHFWMKKLKVRVTLDTVYDCNGIP